MLFFLTCFIVETIFTCNILSEVYFSFYLLSLAIFKYEIFHSYSQVIFPLASISQITENNENVVSFRPNELGELSHE